MARILVAEDGAAIRHFVADVLTMGGHEVIEAHDGVEAMRLLAAGAGPDMLLTDYRMPGADGVAVIVRALQMDPITVCVMMTAMPDLDLAIRGMDAGAVGFLPKPFSPSALRTVVARALERRELSTELMRMRVLAPALERFTMLLASTLETKDLSTQRHSERLATLSDAIALKMGLSSDERIRLRLGAGLHDIGKVAVAEAVLNKPGPLTDDEWAELRLHPETGAGIITDSGMASDVAQIVRHHHEHFDGSGYPDKLRGIAIPLGARIVSVADAVDVMLNGRSYARPRTMEQVLAEIARERGKQFDPDVAEIAISWLAGTQSLVGAEA